MKSSIYIVGIATVVAVALVSQNGNFDRNIKRLPVNQQLMYSPEQQEASTMQAEVLSDMGTQRDVYFADDIKLGAIGMHDGSLVDDPHDNVFDVYIDKNLQDGRQAYLEYELYGVEDFSSVCRSINDEVSVGGAFVKLSNEWKTQTEKIPSDQLRQGVNKVRFSIPSNNEFGYFVKNVRIRFGESVSETRQVVVNQPESRNYYNNAGYVSGYISGTGSKDASVFVGGKPVRLHDGVFEAVVEKSFDSVLGWQTEISVVFADGETIRRKVEFSNPISSDYSNGLEASVPYRVSYASPRMPVSMNLLGFSLQGEVGSVASNVELSVTGLRQQDMPLPSTGMINVTASSDGYRCLPHGNLFSNDVKVHVKYDTARIPKGYGPKDIRTFYYDDVQQDWVMLPLDSVDIENCEIISTTNHFTDFIDGILKTPESPQTQAFTPTSMKDMKYADPLAGVNMMSPPSVNNSGTANMSFPIQVPAGRQGMQPQLAISYNSEGGNGFMGVGWGLNTPSISVETRWGVPRYSTGVESEEYLVNGQQVVELEITANDTLRLPLVHMESYRTRSANSEEIFSYRVEGAFDRIIRHETSPKNYWWEVIDKQGTHYYYGKYSTDAGVNNNCVLKDASDNIAHWALAEVRDVYGNYIKYNYQKISRTTGTGAGGQQLYISSIVYTGFGTTDGKYTVNFEYDGGYRNDYTISGRYGFLEVTDRLLTNIHVKYDGTFIRTYVIKYMDGAYGKKLICAIADVTDQNLVGLINEKNCDGVKKQGLNGNGIKVHSFDYFEEEGLAFESSETTVFGVQELAEGVLNNSFTDQSLQTIGRSLGTNVRIGGSLCIGFGNEFNTKSNTLGFNLTSSLGTLKEKVQLMDINGDGLMDKVVYDNNSIIFYKGELDQSNHLTFSILGSIINDMNDLSRSWSLSQSGGAEAQLSLLGLNSRLNFTKSWTHQLTTKYFADVNADGYVDYINNGITYYNYPDDNDKPVFTQENGNNPIVSVDGDPCYSINHDGEITQTVNTLENEETIIHRRDPVRVWVVPDNFGLKDKQGINIESIIQRVSPSAQNEDISYIIQYNDLPVYCGTISASDLTVHSNTLCVNNVESGDRVYFRLHCDDYNGFDDVNWDTRIHLDGCSNNSLEEDADEKPVYYFRYADDALINDNLYYIAPESGVINISGNISGPAQSDDLNFIIEQNLNSIVSSMFSNNSAFNLPINQNVTVTEGDVIKFKLNSSTNINWSEIDFSALIHYTSYTNIQVNPSNPNGDLEYYPSLQTTQFPRRNLATPTNTIFAAGTYTVTPALAFNNPLQCNGQVVFAAKTSRALLDKTTVTIVNGVISGNPSLQFTLNSSETVYFEFYTDEMSLGDNIDIAQALWGINDYDAGYYSQFSNSLLLFGNMYRGWGQFSYHDDLTSGGCYVINENILQFDYSNIDQSDYENFEQYIYETDFNTLEIDDITAQFSSFGVSGDMNDLVFTPMYADKEKNRWVDFCKSAYTKVDEMGSGSVFQELMSYTTNTDVFESNDQPVPDFINLITTNGCGNSRVPIKYSKQTTNSFSWANGPGTMDVTRTRTKSKGILDFMDMNGDRYPDIVYKDLIQYTGPRGGWSTDILLFSDVFPSQSISKATLLSFGVKGIEMSNSKSTSSTKSLMKNVKGSFGIGTLLTTEGSKLSYTYSDLNGDGLSDRVDAENNSVELNLGYSFSSPKQWDATDISYSLPNTNTVSVSAAYNKKEYSWSAGLGISSDGNSDKRTIMDINNDGLADICFFSSNTIFALINNGHGYYSTAYNLCNITGSGLGHTQSVNVGADGAITGGVAIAQILGITIKITATAYLDMSFNISKEESKLTDLNGDGFPDWVKLGAGNLILANYGVPKKTNILKTVTTPVQSTYTVDYSLDYPDRDNPSAKWVMASLVVYDGHSGDGADYSYYKYEYGKPIYHRMERDFFGYETVKTRQYDNFSSSGICYRVTEEWFHNDNYLFKGLKKYDMIGDGSANINKYVETTYLWDGKQISDGQIVDMSNVDCFGPYYPAISQEDKYFYEGQANSQIHTRKTYRHGRYGNVKQYINYADMTDNTDDIRAEILYTYNLTNHYLAMVSSINVFDYQNQLLRRKTGIYFANGRIRRIGSFDGSNTAFTNITYNPHGNIVLIRYPEDVNGNRLEYSYVYDNVVFTYPISVTDYWGNTSLTTYDYRLGVPLLMTDISNNQMAFTYYNDGKPKSVKGPKEMGTTNETIIFEYWDEPGGGSSANLWAKTRHYDPLNTGNEFVTVNFSDGLGRSIQSKQKATISGVDKMVVSGNVTYDQYGRAVSVSLPTNQALGTETTFYTFTPSNFATTKYDVLDRPTKQTAPDNTTVYYNYDFGQDYFGKICFKTRVTDPNGIETTKYSDARGLNTSVTAPLNTVTSFQYSPLGELLISTDPENYQTGYIYDMMGRLVSRNHPDAGTTSYTYDLAGNVLSTQTENLAGNSQYIVYSYFNCRLNKISYPNNPEMNVYYEYGAPNTQNQSGRLVKQQDASGVQSFEYGNMGELIKNIHTFVVPNGLHYTLQTEWEYDSWNRMKKILYPDGEMVSYHYNNGGQLIAMDGVKGAQSFSYIDNVEYNLYGSREQIDYGNGTYAEYTYNPLNQRLTHLSSYESSGLVMQSIDYGYDNASNILAITNNSTFVNGNLGGDYEYRYTYDNLYRLVGSQGTFGSSQNQLGFVQNLEYSASGNITNKTVNATTEIGGGLQVISYSNTYQYNSSQPHTVSQTDANTYNWDGNGNMTSRVDNNNGFWRNLCWDEENRLTTVRNMAENQNNLSSYIYNAGGERTWKLTGDVMNMYINGQGYVDGVEFEKTLYASPYVVIADAEYTKHYYIEGERVCSKIGGGFGSVPINPSALPNTFLNGDALQTATNLWTMVKRGVDCSDFNPDNVFISVNLPPMNNKVRPKLETSLYFYHPDHIGSSSFITNTIGYAEQHLQYLPFGETFVDQRATTTFNSRYTFSAKEKDDETQYSYFGARYYDSDLSVWLSVDPMAFKYPHESPFCYVGNRPLNTIDPWGMDKIEDPNGDTQNAGDGYKQTGDKKFLYGEGLKTKVWDPNQENGTSKGSYVDYEGPGIDFSEYGKLKGGRYDGTSFNSIETGSGRDFWGSSWSVSKTQFSNSEYQNYAQTLSEDLNNSGQALMTMGAFLGGIDVASGARSFLKNPKNFIKSLTPWSLMMTYFIYVGFQEQQTAQEMQSILNAYHSLHAQNPEDSQGMYMIEIYSHGAVPAPGGMGVSNRLYFYYDISSGMFLGQISVP